MLFAVGVALTLWVRAQQHRVEQQRQQQSQQQRLCVSGSSPMPLGVMDSLLSVGAARRVSPAARATK